MSNRTPFHNASGDGVATAEAPTVTPPRKREGKDEYETPEVAYRRTKREIKDLLALGYTIRPVEGKPGFHALYDLDGRRGQLIRPERMDAAREAEAEFADEQAKLDPAAIPIANGGDGRRVDTAALCRELGLPEPLAELKTMVLQITPDIAQALLDRNTRNRPLNRNTSRRYGKAMREGRWKLSPDGIGIDWNGDLINGQHRLSAIMEECLPQWFHVNIDLDPATFSVMDNGKPRSAGEALSIERYTHPRLRAAIIRYLLAAKAGRLWINERRAEPDEVVAAAPDFEDRMEECVTTAKQVSRKSGKLLTESAVGFLLYAYGAEHPERIHDYVNRIATQLGCSIEDDPAYVVYRALQRDKDNQTRMRHSEYLALLVRGAERFVHGEPMRYARGNRLTTWPQFSIADSLGWLPQVIPSKMTYANAEVLEDEAPDDEDDA